MFDPRSGRDDVGFMISRHLCGGRCRRPLRRAVPAGEHDPAAANKPGHQPALSSIVDSGAPEQIPLQAADRSAFLGGRNAFRGGGVPGILTALEVLAEGAHSARRALYNVIQWDARQDAGWSYGRGVYDPRHRRDCEGERSISAASACGRSRNDLRGLPAQAKDRHGAKADDPVELGASRIRQTGRAFEVGHTPWLLRTIFAGLAECRPR